MPILFHSDFDINFLEKEYKKTLDQLCRGDFNSADVRKMSSGGFYRARLDIRARLLFKLITYKGVKHILLLELIKDHNYKASRFLRGAVIGEETSLPLVKDPENELPCADSQLRYLNPDSRKIHYLNKFLSFDALQAGVLQLTAPLVIIGAAGSGKTALVLEKLKMLPGIVAYISLSKFLVENASNLYYSGGYRNDQQEVEFLSLTDYLNSWSKLQGKEVSFTDFEAWYQRHQQTVKINDPYRVFEELKGVITGAATDAPYLTEEQYLALGVRQSVFNIHERQKIYPLFKKYLHWLQEQGFYDSNIACFERLEKVQPVYNYIMVDEVQDLTSMQLNCLMKSLTTAGNFILTGDSNQIVHPNLFSWARVKSYFHGKTDLNRQIQLLQTNYRNSAEVVRLSNYLLKIRNHRFGSIDKESNCLVRTISGDQGEVLLFPDQDKTKKELNRRTQNSARFAVIVTDNKYKQAARSFFKTPLVFSVQEAKGLEYENVILMNLVSNSDKQFREIIAGVGQDDLEGEELTYSRAANKADKDAEIYKFYINAFYVAITRAVKNIYLFEGKIDHPIFALMQLRETQKGLQVKEEKSSRDEWLEEAKRLEQQGKLEQAEQIRAKYLGYEYLDQVQLEHIKTLALDPSKKEQEVKKERKQLFQYAVHHHRFDWIDVLAGLQFPRAIAYMKEIKMARKDFLKDIRTGKTQSALSTVGKYGTGFTIEEGVDGLMLSLYHGNQSFAEAMLQQKVSLIRSDDKGRIALDHLLAGYFSHLETKNQLLATSETLQTFYEQVRPSSITLDTGDRVRYINGQSMVFFLMTIMRAVASNRCLDTDTDTVQNKNTVGIAAQGGEFSISDIVDLTDNFPDEILPDYRKKRTYISGILSTNEVSRLHIPYCKGVFIRVGRGKYRLNPSVHL